MITYINVSKRSTDYEVGLDGFSVELNIYYSKFADRWLMDVENRSNQQKVKGIVMNVGIDLLSTAGRLGLQVLILISLPKPGIEASFENFGEGVQLAHMTLEEYDAYVLDQLTPDQIDPESDTYVDKDFRTSSRSQWV